MSMENFLTDLNRFMPAGNEVGLVADIPIVCKLDNNCSVEVTVKMKNTGEGWVPVEDTKVVGKRIIKKFQTVYPELFGNDAPGDEVAGSEQSEYNKT